MHRFLRNPIALAGSILLFLLGTFTLSATAQQAENAILSSAASPVASGLGVRGLVSTTPPTLNFSPALTHLPLVQGGSVTDVFTFTGGGSYQGNVTLAVSGLPTGLTASWSNSPVTMTSGNGNSTLTLRATTTVAPNWYTFTVTANGDGLTVAWQYTAVVSQAPGMTMGLSMTSLSMQSMGTASLKVTATTQGGLAVQPSGAGASVAIASGLPAGVSAAWSQPLVTGTTSVAWTVTLTGSTAAVASSGNLSITTKIVDANSGTTYSASQVAALKVALTAPTLAFSPALTHIPLQIGSKATDVFTFTGGGSFHGNISLTVSGLPSGITAAWSANPVALSSNTGTSTLTLVATSAVPANWYTFTVTATGDGLTVAWQYTAQVTQSLGMQMALSQSTLSMQSMNTASITVTATPQGAVKVPAGAAGAAVSITSGLPAGIAATWSAPTLSSAGAVSWKLTLTGSNTALASSGTLRLTAQITDATTGTVYSASQGLSLTVVLTAPTLKFSPAVTHVPVLQGSAVTDLFTITTGGSFHGTVNLAVSGLPGGVSSSWSNNPVTINSGTGTATLSLAASSSLAANWYTFTVTATGDGLSVAWQYTVEVEPLTGIQMQLSQAALALEPQAKANLTITGTPTNGIKVMDGGVGSNVTITSGLPSGVTAALSAPTVAPSGAVSWTLTFSADNTAATGESAVNVAMQITDKTSGMVYITNQKLALLISLLGDVKIGTTVGKTIPSTFMGFSHEWGQAQTMMGSATSGTNAIYRQLLTNLTAYGSGPIHLRIGGNSTDTTVEPTASTVTPFVELQKAQGVHFTLGVNLGSNNVTLATDQAKAYLTQMPSGSVEAIEIGNEPDLYVKNGVRPSTYTVQDYFSEFSTWNAGIQPLLSNGTKLMGTAWASTGMLSNIQSFETQQSSSLNLFSQHYYATTPSNNPAADFLLTPAVATAGPTAVASAVAATHAYGLPFRMGEINSMSNIGQHGISDAFGAALWAIDTMYEYANVGVDGMNWEASEGNDDSPFYFSVQSSGGKSTYTVSSISPLYYGLLFFQNATQNTAQLLPVTLNTAANLKAWATVDSSAVTRVAVINKDETQDGDVAITMPGFSQATVVRLSAPSYQSTAGVTLAGQTFDGSKDGTIQGSQTTETIQGADGVFYLSMPITSAALVVFSN